MKIDRLSGGLCIASPALIILLSMSVALPERVEAAIVINEIHYHPPSETQSEEFIELTNTGLEAVDLEGWRLENGIDFVFGAGNVIPPGGYRVVAKSVSDFAVAFPSVVGEVTGNFQRNLGNAGDQIDLRNAQGDLIDSVIYLDDLPWPEAADGEGSSLELIHPGLENSQAGSWQSSLGSPTPGSENSAFSLNPSPIISDVRHFPLEPKPTDPIRILLGVTDNGPIQSVQAYWRVAPPTSEAEISKRPTNPNPGNQTSDFQEVTLFDDGSHSDGLPGDGTFGGLLPIQTNHAVIEFYIQARDTSNQTTVFPESAPNKNALIQVDSADHPDNLSRFRIVMTPQDLDTLRTRDVFDNDLLNCTLLAEGEAYYQQGIRYRGSSSRVLGPRESFRIEMGPNIAFQNLRELNFNGNGTLQQSISWDLFAAMGISNPRRQLFHLVLNNNFYANYFQIESIDTPFLRSNFGSDHNGNLYRGVEDASLEYLGPDPSRYFQVYEKKNNRASNDCSDIINLTQSFSIPSEMDFTEDIRNRLDVRQWQRFFALNSVLANSENGIQLNSGDDYFLYRREDDGRFIILPWDLDGTFANTGERLFRQRIKAIQRLVQNPEFVRLYYLGIEEALEGPFFPTEMERLVDTYRGVFTDQELDGILFISNARSNFLKQQYPRSLSVEFPDGEIDSLETCPRPILEQENLHLRGQSHAAHTVSVRINDATASWDPMAGTWEMTVPLFPGENPLLIESIDEFGQVSEVIEFTVYNPQDFQSIGGEIAGDVELRSASSPYRISSHLTIPVTATLTIEPGCQILIDEGIGVLVHGHIEAVGEEEAPIVFRTNGCGRWGGFGIQSRTNRFENCEFYRASSTEIKGIPVPMAITLNGGGVEVADCRFLDCIRCFNVNNGGTLDLRSSLIQECELGVFAVNSDCVVQGCMFGETRNGYDTIQFIGRGKTPSIIRENRLEGGNRDGIDLEGSDCLVIQNEISGFQEGAGIRVRGEDSPLLLRNVLYDCVEGMSLTADAFARVNHCTVTENNIGIDINSDSIPSATPSGYIRNTIFWSNGSDLIGGDGSNLSITHSDFGQSPPNGQHILSTNPLFADPDNGDYRLRANSPMLKEAENGLDIGAYQQSIGQRSFWLLR